MGYGLLFFLWFKTKEGFQNRFIPSRILATFAIQNAAGTMRILIFLLLFLPHPSTLQTLIWPEQLEVAASSLKLRDAPNLQSKVLATIPQGAWVKNRSRQFEDRLQWEEIDEMGAYWLPVQYQGQNGYVFGAYVNAPFQLFYEKTAVDYVPKVNHWYAVYSTPKGDELREVKVHTTLDSNEVLEELQRTLRTDNPEESKFILATNRELKTGLIGDFFNQNSETTPENASDFALTPGTSLLLTRSRPWNDNKIYTFFGTGNFELSQEGLVQKNYKIWATQRTESRLGFDLQQDLALFLGPSVAFCTLNWYGDLDGDGKPDALISRCTEDAGCTDVLFLSSEAKSGELLHPVAAYFWGLGC